MKPRSLALALGTAHWGVGLAGPLAGDKPNVLFLMPDDLRPELGCYDPGENKNVAAEPARRVEVLSRKLAKVHPVKRHPADD